MSALLVVKALLKGDLRRLSVAPDVALSELCTTLQSLYRLNDLAEYTIKYTDDEGATPTVHVTRTPFILPVFTVLAN